MTSPIKVRLVVVLVGLAFLSAVYLQFSGAIGIEREHLAKRGEHHAQILNDQIRVAKKTAEGLKAAMELSLSQEEPLRSDYSAYLGTIPDRDGYGLVGLPPPSDPGKALNLTGLGRIEAEPAFQRELNASLSLEMMFRWVKGFYPDTPWVYYLSNRRFMTVYPYLSFGQFFMDDSFYTMDLYARATPQRNPRGEPYITDAYLDEAGQRLMVTVGAPVYHGSEFLGIVGFDLTLKTLSESLQHYRMPGDNIYLVNDRAEIIAVAGADYPDGVLSRKRSIHELRPGLFEASLANLNKTAVSFDGTLIVSRELLHSPWQLITERSRWLVYRSVIGSILPPIALVVLIIAAMSLFVRETQRQRRIDSERSSRRFRDLLDSSSDMITVIDPVSGRFLDVNKTMCEFMGMSRQELLAIRVCEFSADMDSPQKWQDSVTRLREQRHFTMEDMGKRPDGRPFMMELNIHLAKEEGQEYIVAIIRDIAGRKRAEMERKQLERRLQQTQKMEAIGQLTGGIAHDFNNILVSVIGFAELARHEAGTNKQLHGHLDQILKSGNRARNLIKQLLVYSRGENRKTAEPIAIVPQLEEILSMLRPLLSTMIEIRTQWPETSPVVTIDPLHLQQVLMNLSINAREAMQAGGVLSIRVSEGIIHEGNCRICHEKINGIWVRIRIQDTGKGIPSNQTEKIFEPFFTTKRAGEGGGMGLSVVQGIVTTYGGHILVDSRLGHGSTVDLLLPPADQVVLPHEADSKPISQPLDLKGREILIVDDEPVVRLYLERVLASTYAEVTTCPSAKDALHLFIQDPDRFDLIITDQTMPETSGITLAQQIRATNKTVPVMLFSGNADVAASPQQLQQLGISRVLLKPVTAAELTTAIQQAISES